MKSVAFVLVSAWLPCVAACSGSADSTFPSAAPPAAPLVGGSGGGSPALSPSAPSSPPEAATTCTAAAKLVYVISQEKDLYSFAPDTLTFTKIGPVACPGTSVVPSSMAVDRTGTAWVNYATGGLYKVSTSDASCVDSGFVPNQQGFLKFGMAFATAGGSSTDETLYVSGLLGTSGKGLGKVDLQTLKLSMLGQYSDTLAGQAAELTGTGDGRLYGFFTTSPATLALIDQAKAATSSDTPLAGVSTGNAFAFSFWGGDFWLYTSDGPTPSKVTHLKSTGELTVAMADVGGFRIVGAGVSTCAPLTYEAPH